MRHYPISSKEVKAYRGQNPLSTIATLKEGKKEILDLIRARVEEFDIAKLAERNGELDPEKLSFSPKLGVAKVGIAAGP